MTDESLALLRAHCAAAQAWRAYLALVMGVSQLPVDATACKAAWLDAERTLRTLLEVS